MRYMTLVVFFIFLLHLAKTSLSSSPLLHTTKGCSEKQPKHGKPTHKLPPNKPPHKTPYHHKPTVKPPQRKPWKAPNHPKYPAKPHPSTRPPSCPPTIFHPPLLNPPPDRAHVYSPPSFTRAPVTYHPKPNPPMAVYPYSSPPPPPLLYPPPALYQPGIPLMPPLPPLLPFDPPASTCPADTIKIGACVDLLGGLIHIGPIGVGREAQQKCCPVLQGLVDLDAAVCLCTTIKAKLLNIDIIIPIALQILIDCGKHPTSFQCSTS